MYNQLQFGKYTDDVKEWLSGGNLHSWEVEGKEIFLKMITPRLRFQECNTAGHTKSGAGKDNADRTGSGNKCM